MNNVCWFGCCRSENMQEIRRLRGALEAATHKWATAETALEAANARAGKCGMEGHNEPCHYCGEPCNSLVGWPSRWPVALCHEDDPGVVKWHHTGCVMERLAKDDAANARIAELEGAVKRQASQLHDAWYLNGTLARTERAEAECKALREALQKAIAAMERASVLLEIESRDREINLAIAEARAALNPAPTEREG